MEFAADELLLNELERYILIEDGKCLLCCMNSSDGCIMASDVSFNGNCFVQEIIVIKLNYSV